MEQEPMHDHPAGASAIPGRLVLYFILDLSEGYRSEWAQAIRTIRQTLSHSCEACHQADSQKKPRVHFTVIGMGQNAFQAFPVVPASDADRIFEHVQLDHLPTCSDVNLASAFKVLADSLKFELFNIGDGDAKPFVFFLTNSGTFREDVSTSQSSADKRKGRKRSTSQDSLQFDEMDSDSIRRLYYCQSYIWLHPDSEKWKQAFVAFAQRHPQLSQHTIASVSQWEEKIETVLLRSVKMHMRERTLSHSWPYQIPSQTYVPHPDCSGNQPISESWLEPLWIQPQQGQGVPIRLPIRGLANVHVDLHGMVESAFTFDQDEDLQFDLTLPADTPINTLLRGHLLVETTNSKHCIPLIGWVHSVCSHQKRTEQQPVSRNSRGSLWAAILMLFILLAGVGYWYYIHQAANIQLTYSFPRMKVNEYTIGKVVSDPLRFMITVDGHLPENLQLKLTCPMKIDFFKDPLHSTEKESFVTEETAVYDITQKQQEIEFRYMKDSRFNGDALSIFGEIKFSCTDPNVQILIENLMFERHIKMTQ